jgi:hypothetical protein
MTREPNSGSTITKLIGRTLPGRPSLMLLLDKSTRGMSSPDLSLLVQSKLVVV